MSAREQLIDSYGPNTGARIERALRHITAFRSRPSVKLLDVIYGPRAKPLRTAVAALILGWRVTGSDKIAQYGNLRKMLLDLVGVDRGPDTYTAGEDRDFEEKAEAILNS